MGADDQALKCMKNQLSKYKAKIICFGRIKLVYYMLTKLLIAISRWFESYTVQASKEISK